MKLADLVQLIAQAIWKTCSRTVNFDFCELKKTLVPILKIFKSNFVLIFSKFLVLEVDFKIQLLLFKIFPSKFVGHFCIQSSGKG